MTNISEFIVESIDESDTLWKFFNNMQKLDDENQDPHARFAKKFTSMATNATIFRWKFGEQHDNPLIETTLNPYIHKFHGPGTYNVSHQSCAPCLNMDPPLICSNGWCTKSVNVVSPSEGNSLAALAGLAGILIIIKGEDCCDLRKRCAEKRAICKEVKPADTENIKTCKVIEQTCTDKLEECRKECIKTGYAWESSIYKCTENQRPYKEICQTIEHQKRYKKDRRDQNK